MNNASLYKKVIFDDMMIKFTGSKRFFSVKSYALLYTNVHVSISTNLRMIVSCSISYTNFDDSNSSK